MIYKPWLKILLLSGLVHTLVGCKSESDGKSIHVIKNDAAGVAAVSCDNSFVAFADDRLWLGRVDDNASTVQIPLSIRLNHHTVNESRFACDLGRLVIRAAEKGKRFTNTIFVIPIENPTSGYQLELEFSATRLAVDKNSIWVRSGSGGFYVPALPDEYGRLTKYANKYSLFLTDAERAAQVGNRSGKIDERNYLLEIFKLDPFQPQIVESRPFPDSNAIGVNGDGTWSVLFLRQAISYELKEGEVNTLTNYRFGEFPFRNFYGTIQYSGRSIFSVSQARTRAKDEPPGIDALWRYDPDSESWLTEVKLPFPPTSVLFGDTSIAVGGKGNFGVFQTNTKTWKILSGIPKDRVPFGIAEIHPGKFVVIGMNSKVTTKAYSEFDTQLMLDLIDTNEPSLNSSLNLGVAHSAPGIASPMSGAADRNVQLF